MKRNSLICLLVFAALFGNSQGIENYQSSDPRQPVVFGGSYIVYNRDTVESGSRSFFIDGRLTCAG